MPVVVGWGAKSRTPVLGGEISHLVFRPYWYVTRSVIGKEMLPAYAKTPKYSDEHQFEVTVSSDDGKPGLPAKRANVELLRAGRLGVRQRPGPRSSLGKVKLVFPSRDSVCLRDTPATSLFARDRRDFAHGCARVSDPPALAAILLWTVPGWGAAEITAAMDAERPKVVLVRPPVAVRLLCSTVLGSADARIAFFDDVYRKCGPAFPAIPGGSRRTPQPASLFSMWSMTSECSFCGLNRMTSASAPTFTVCPGGQ